MELLVSVARSVLVVVGLFGLSTVPAAAQARSTIVATATVIDLSEARAALQIADGLLADARLESRLTGESSRRETGTASVLVSYPERRNSGVPLAPTLATIVYW